MEADRRNRGLSAAAGAMLLPALLALPRPRARRAEGLGDTTLLARYTAF